MKGMYPLIISGSTHVVIPLARHLQVLLQTSKPRIPNIRSIQKRQEIEQREERQQILVASPQQPLGLSLCELRAREHLPDILLRRGAAFVLDSPFLVGGRDGMDLSLVVQGPVCVHDDGRNK